MYYLVNTILFIFLWLFVTFSYFYCFYYVHKMMYI